MNLNASTLRYLLRATVAMALAGIGVASTIWVDNDILKIAGPMLVVAAGYLGVGALSPQVEPFVGVKADKVGVAYGPMITRED